MLLFAFKCTEFANLLHYEFVGRTTTRDATSLSNRLFPAEAGKKDVFDLAMDREDCPWVKGNPCPKSVNSSTHICSSFSGVISVVSPVGERRASGSNSGKVVQAVRRSGYYCNVCYPC